MKLKLPRFTVQVSAAYEREVLRKPINRVKFFIGAGFFVFVLFFILGIRPVAINSAENTKLLSELKEVRSNMQTKLDQIDESEKDLAGLEKNIEYINSLLPNEGNVQNYLKEFVVIAAKNDFFVRKFTKPTSASSSAIALEIEIIGKLNNLPALISAIEESQRVTNINEITLSNIEEEENYSIRLEMEIYTLE